MALLVAFFLLCAATSSFAAAKPNILFIVIDEYVFRTCSCPPSSHLDVYICK